jgi:hypothetical protein
MAEKIESKTTFKRELERLHVEELMSTTREPSEEHAWIKAPNVETWISYPPLNGIPLEDFYIESMLVLLCKIFSSTNDNLSLTMSR